MLSITTQVLLAEHLRLISELELDVYPILYPFFIYKITIKLELIREVLSEQKQFDPATAFLALTHCKTFKTPLSPNDLHEFFLSNNSLCKPKEIARLIKCYDSNGNLHLSFQE